MPFTLSHAAAVIPIKHKFREYLPLSALVVGSFSPDFKYFFPFTKLGIFSHSFTGIFLFCLPISLLVLWLFHGLVKEPLLHLTPANFQQRLAAVATKFSFFPLGNFTAITLAIIIGASTHIIWDSFTHEHGWVVENWPILNTMLSKVWYYDLQVFSLLQHLSTFTGLLLLIYWFWRWFHKTEVENRSWQAATISRNMGRNIKIKIWFFLSGFSLVFGIAQGMIKSRQQVGSFAIEVFVVQSVVGWMLGAAIITLLYSLIYRSGAINLLKEWLEESE